MQYSNFTDRSGTDEESQKIATLTESTMTDEEIKMRSKQDFQHKMTGLELLREAAVEKFITQRNKCNAKVNNTDELKEIEEDEAYDNNSTATPKTNLNKKKTRRHKNNAKQSTSGETAGQKE